MRLALQLIALCVSDGVMHFDASHFTSSTSEEVLDIGMQLTVNVAIRRLTVLFIFKLYQLTIYFKVNDFR